MRPLLFLTFHSLWNNLKRGLTSPKRLVTTSLVVAYYFWIFMRPLVGASVRIGGPIPGQGVTQFPPVRTIGAFVFIGFAVYSLFMTLGMFGIRSAFKAADVDVLFPTPVSPRLVLIFRIARDYLATLLVPLFLMLVVWRPIDFHYVFSKVPHPESAGYVVLALSASFILLTAAWVAMSFAVTLYVNRNDRFSDTRKRIVGWGIAAPSLGVVAYAVLEAFKFGSLGDFVRFAQQPWLHVFFFTATPASMMVMGPLEGSSGAVLVGAGALVLLAGAAVYLALAQSQWMYDQAAVRGYGAESMRQLQHKGDFMGIVAESARRGKSKARRPGWFQSLRLHGYAGLIWKDVLIQWRSVRGMVTLFLLMGVLFILMPFMAGLRDSDGFVGYIVLAMEGFVAFIVAIMTAQSGFTELLKRVDLQKPLPFGPQGIVTSEIVAKALPASIIALLSSLLALALFPATWPAVLAGAIFFPSFVSVICAVVCVIVLLFPEIDDVS
ncbi:MAG TPA: putative ABC exporter domain-containing protein, partial [Fimbriimonadaceae bacterium]|nr:putative ABC exporter domain-containing protein [Fimbriimonadaceae bacterium]